MIDNTISYNTYASNFNRANSLYGSYNDEGLPEELREMLENKSSKYKTD